MIVVNYKDPRPIYEQVKDGFRRLMITGAVRPDDKLPSVRELSSQLMINVNTIQKAYRELEAEGYIYTVAGRGSFASERTEVDSSRRALLLKSFDETVSELLFLGVGEQELRARIEEKGEQA